MALTERVDYLQRCTPLAHDVAGTHTVGEVSSRRQLWLRGIGRADVEPERPRPAPEERWRPQTAGLITGLYGYRIPLAFALRGGPEGVEVTLGTWSTKTGGATQDRRRDVVRSVLAGLYAHVNVEEVADQGWEWPLSGVALGTPAPTGIQPEDGFAPVDRVIAALAGTSWAALVLAFPVAESSVSVVRQQVLNEMRAVEAEAAAEGASSPLAEHYVELLKLSLKALGEGLATGAWRTAVYLLGDGRSYPQLAASWRSVFSGLGSLPEPVRVFDLPAAAELARSWALPNAPGAAAPGRYQRPFEFQTLLTSPQLAAYMHLPELETPGFSVERIARFDSVRSSAVGAAVGRIVHRRRDTGTDYRIPLNSLTRHAFVAGVTGSGKTNTIFALLNEASAANVPFLVIEPAKREYRALIEHPDFGPRTRVFTAGDALVSPFRLNPFEVPAGTSVAEHLDLVRAAFSAAFGMWTPLPQILERCLHDVYADRGWDLRTGANARLAPGEDRADAFPTLADLTAKARTVIRGLGYEERIAGDLEAALVTRLESLRSGGKGMMLDVARSMPIGELLAQPTVLELEAMGDENDKAFLAALVLIRLAEHRRSDGQRDELVHLLVVEEAHRLLANVAVHSAEEAGNPRGQAVEVFSNLLSEIRAYGQGVIVADQVPVRLAPDVIKNTNLKIAHRTVSEDDRNALGGAMAMDASQTRALTTLRTGEAAVFGGGDDSPMLVQMLPAKGANSGPPGDDAVARHMAAWRGSELFLPRPFCVETCRGAPEACATARRLMADEYVQRSVARSVLATIEEADALDRLWEDLLAVVNARRPPALAEAELLRALAGHAADWYAGRRGAQGQWSYAATEALRGELQALLLDRATGSSADGVRLRAAFQVSARALHRRAFAPYPVCERVCTQDPPLCLYRSAVADLVSSGRLQSSWRDADASDATSSEGRRAETWEVCQDAAYELIEFPDDSAPPDVNDQIAEAARRVCVCFEQQMLADDLRKVPRTARRILARVLAEAGL